VSSDKTSRLWDRLTGAALATLAGHSDRVRTVAFSPDGKLLATGSSDKTVRLWNVDTKKCVWVLKGPKDSVNDVVFSPDGSHIIAVTGHQLASDDKTHCLDVKTGTELEGKKPSHGAREDGLGKRFVGSKLSFVHATALYSPTPSVSRLISSARCFF
jgi:WD40 repeat protein